MGLSARLGCEDDDSGGGGGLLHGETTTAALRGREEAEDAGRYRNEAVVVVVGVEREDGCGVSHHADGAAVVGVRDGEARVDSGAGWYERWCTGGNEA